MQFLFDNLTAIIVAGVVILMLATAQIYAQRSGLEQASSYSTKAKAISFGEWLEDDILSLGANYGDDAYRFMTPVEDPVTGHTRRWVFFSDSLLATGDTLRIITRYELQDLGAVVRGDSTIYLYEIHRMMAEEPVTNGAISAPDPSDWTTDGRSMSTLSAFNVSMLARDGSVTSDPERGEFIRVSFSLVPEFPIEPEYLRELYWTTTLKVRPFWEPMSG